MILKIDNLSFSYPSHAVLKEVCFSVNQGDCMGILGTNGAGKSTLLKCINRVLVAQSGKIHLADKCISEMSQNQLAQKIAYVSQSSCPGRMNVFDTVLIGRKPYIKWEASAEDLQIVESALKTLHLEKYALRYVDELSGGEYQKVVIARALAQKPEILMLDEPTASLDLKNQLEVVELIKAVVQEQKIAALVTIHDLNLALRLANKFILLKEGSIYAVGGLEIITTEAIEAVYGVKVDIEKIRGQWMVVPQ